MRKFFVFLSVAIIVAFCAFPAFASEPDPSKIVYAPVPFDSIIYGVNHNDPFPLNSFNSWASPNDDFLFETFDGFVGSAWLYESNGRYGLDSQFDVPTSFSLYTSNFFVQPNYLRDSDIRFRVYSKISSVDEVFFESLNISFTGVYYLFNNETQVYEPEFVERNFTIDLHADEFYLNGILSGLFDGILPTFIETRTVVCIQDLQIDFNLTESDLYDLEYEIHYSWLGSPTPESNDADIFFYQYGPFYSAVGSPENQASLMSFFTDTIGGIMNFELFPGLSFGLIFYIVLVIGIVLWLVTILI